MIKEIVIYTDGASKGNPGKGGYGIVMTLAGTSYQKEFFQGFRLTTNNRMELLAVIEALLKIKDKNCIVNIYSDSKYVVDAINKGWINNWKKKNYKDVKNPDLWKQLIAMLPEYKVSFFWVRGHNGNPLNEKADKLAVQGAESSELKADLYYEQAIHNQ